MRLLIEFQQLRWPWFMLFWISSQYMESWSLACPSASYMQTRCWFSWTIVSQSLAEETPHILTLINDIPSYRHSDSVEASGGPVLSNGIVFAHNRPTETTLSGRRGWASQELEEVNNKAEAGRIWRLSCRVVRSSRTMIKSCIQRHFPIQNSLNTTFRASSTSTVPDTWPRVFAV